MDVILLDDVDKLGLRGDVVSVARGYARNFLFPRRLAEEASTARVAELRKREEQQAAAPPESGPAEEVEVEAEEIDAGPEDVAVESESDDFDESVEAAAVNDEL